MKYDIFILMILYSYLDRLFRLVTNFDTGPVSALTTYAPGSGYPK